jgi:hypothetical protein
VAVQGTQIKEIKARCRKTKGTTISQLGRTGRTQPGFPTVTNAALPWARPVEVLLMATSLISNASQIKSDHHVLLLAFWLLLAIGFLQALQGKYYRLGVTP